MEIFGEPSPPQKKSLEFIRKERSRATALGASTACLATKVHHGKSIPFELPLRDARKSSPTARSRPCPKERYASPIRVERPSVLTVHRDGQKPTSHPLGRATNKHRDVSPSKPSQRYESPRRSRRMCADEQETGWPNKIASEAKVQVRSSSEQEKEAILTTLFCRGRCQAPRTSGHVSPERPRRRKSPHKRTGNDRRPPIDALSSDEARNHHRTREKGSRHDQATSMAPEQMGDWVLGNKFRTQTW